MRPSFRLLGERSNPGALPHLHYRSFPAAEVDSGARRRDVVIVQIESAAALGAVEEIAAVKEIKLLLIGLNDLLADWGVAGAYDDPRVRGAYASAIAACRKHGKHCRASAALPRDPISWPSSSSWVRATFPPGPTSLSC